MVLLSDRMFHALLNDILYNQTVTVTMRGDITITANVPICEFQTFFFFFFFFFFLFVLECIC